MLSSLACVASFSVADWELLALALSNAPSFARKNVNIFKEYRWTYRLR